MGSKLLPAAMLSGLCIILICISKAFDLLHLTLFDYVGFSSNGEEVL